MEYLEQGRIGGRSQHRASASGAAATAGGDVFDNTFGAIGFGVAAGVSTETGGQGPTVGGK